MPHWERHFGRAGQAGIHLTHPRPSLESVSLDDRSVPASADGGRRGWKLLVCAGEDREQGGSVGNTQSGARIPTWPGVVTPVVTRSDVSETGRRYLGVRGFRRVVR